MSLRRRVMGQGEKAKLGIYEFDVEITSETKNWNYIENTMIPSVFDGIWLAAAIYSVEDLSNNGNKYTSNFIARQNPSFFNPLVQHLLPLTLTLNGVENTYTSIPMQLFGYTYTANIDGIQRAPAASNNTYSLNPGRHRLVVYGIKNMEVSS